MFTRIQKTSSDTTTVASNQVQNNESTKHSNGTNCTQDEQITSKKLQYIGDGAYKTELPQTTVYALQQKMQIMSTQTPLIFQFFLLWKHG